MPLGSQIGIIYLLKIVLEAPLHRMLVCGARMMMECVVMMGAVVLSRRTAEGLEKPVHSTVFCSLTWCNSERPQSSVTAPASEGRRCSAAIGILRARTMLITRHTKCRDPHCAMVIRKRVVFAAITVLSVLWLLFLVSDFSSAGLGEVFSTFGGQRSREDNEELTVHDKTWTSKQPLEALTEISQSSPEVPGSELLSNGYPGILILSPLKKVRGHITSYFTLLHSLSYPKNSLSLGFLVSDSDDGSYNLVRDHFLERKRTITNQTEKYHDVTLVHQNFNYNPGSTWLDVHSMRNQIPRRKVLAKSRNYLLFSSLRPHHEWVLWIDSDVSYFASTLVQDLLSFTDPERHIVVPNSFWRDEKGEERPYDRNSWRETPESRKFLQQTQEVVVFEGYSAYSTGRIALGDLRGGNDSVVKLDGVGGTVLLVRARLHREGLVFLPVPFEKAMETEALGKLALGMGYQPWGLPNYITIH